MKAIVYTGYGGPEVLKLKEVQKPVPKDNEVLIKVHATAVTTADTMARRGDTLLGRLVLGFGKPRRKIIGSELAGEIEAVGKEAGRFKKGDQVYGFVGFGLGSYAEYNCMPENGSLELKPINMDYAEAAATVDGATTALFFLNKGNIQSGLDPTNVHHKQNFPVKKVLINGASGSIGTFAVQIAKYFGSEVTGVCSTSNLELVKSLGADKVIDYTKEDFTKNGETYDIIFDTVGKSSFARCKGSINKKGCYLVTVFGLVPVIQTLCTKMTGGRKVIFAFSIKKNEELVFIKKLIESGKIKPVIDRCYPLEQIAEAHSYVEKGHKKGNVVITVRSDVSSGLIHSEKRGALE